MEFRFTLEFASMSDTGQVRSHNEDAIAVRPDIGLVVLADGMGGYNAGEVASSIAISVIQQVVESQLQASVDISTDNALASINSLLVQAVESANLAILDASLQEPAYRGMGTTLVMAFFRGDTVTVAHVGDSRAYLLRDRHLAQITRDHSLLQEQLDAGLITPEQARFAQHKNLITRAVGVDYALETETNQFDVEPEDCYLLCSDGLSDMLSDTTIADIMHAGGDDLNACGRALVAQANEEGGRDNISVILIRVRAAD